MLDSLIDARTCAMYASYLQAAVERQLAARLCLHKRRLCLHKRSHVSDNALHARVGWTAQEQLGYS